MRQRQLQIIAGAMLVLAAPLLGQEDCGEHFSEKEITALMHRVNDYTTQTASWKRRLQKQKAKKIWSIASPQIEERRKRFTRTVK